MERMTVLIIMRLGETISMQTSEGKEQIIYTKTSEEHKLASSCVSVNVSVSETVIIHVCMCVCSVELLI